MAGFSTDKNAVDARIGSLVLQLRDSLDGIERVKVWLDGKTTQDLVDLGYSEGDVAVIKSAFTDLSNLAGIAEGRGTQVEVSDFFFWARQLVGVH